MILSSVLPVFLILHRVLKLAENDQYFFLFYSVQWYFNNIGINIYIEISVHQQRKCTQKYLHVVSNMTFFLLWNFLFHIMDVNGVQNQKKVNLYERNMRDWWKDSHFKDRARLQTIFLLNKQLWITNNSSGI